MKNKLILFTADFPFGTGETFLETEIHYLAEGFDEVLIISQNTIGQQTREIPPNCEVRRINLSLTKIQKLQALFNFFDPLFWKERSIIKSLYKITITKGIISTMLISLFQGKRVRNYIKKLLTGEKNDVKLFLYSYWCDDVALGLALAQDECPKVKTLCRIHRWDVYFEESTISYLPFRKTITQNIGKIFSISQDGIDYAKAVWKTGLDDKFELSRLGVNNSINPANIERNYLLLVSCSNIIPVKRVYLIAEALKGITESAIKWIHFGDGPERMQIETIISNLPSNIRVELMGRRDNKEIYTYYNEIRPHLFINVSSSEGVPVSIMEAMSFGIPVIATNVGGNSEIVNCENGYLLKADIKPMELAETIKSFIDLSSTLQEMKQVASFETWKMMYNADDNFSQFVKTIQDL